MKLAEILACCLLVFPLVGTVPPSVPHRRAKLLPLTADRIARRRSLDPVRIEGTNLFRQGQFAEAQNRFESFRESALALHQLDLAAQATVNIGACQFATRHYQSALRTFLEARRMIEEAGDTSKAAIVDGNLGSLYREMGDLDAAVYWTERSFENLSGKDRELHLPEIQVTLASLRAAQNRMPEALEIFRKAMDGADRAGNVALYTQACNRMGEELLRHHFLPQAESALVEAYRVRTLRRLPLDSSYRSLGRLRMEQGDLEAASLLLDRAVELAAGPAGPLPTWDIYHYRGRVRLEQGRLGGALDDLRIALRLARAWRWSAPRDDASRVGNEGWLDQVYAAFIDAGNRLYVETRDPALIRETFEAAEENRAGSLRALFQERQAQMAELPQSYWEALSGLQRAEIAALRSIDSAAQRQVQAARVQLAVMEASSVSPGQPTPGEMLPHLESALDTETLLLTFQLGETDSWLWAVDRAGLTLYRLPPRQEVQQQATAAVSAIQNDSPKASAAAAALYRTLFGTLPVRLSRKPRWLLSLDPALLDVPVAALIVDERPTPPLYVVDRHSIEVVPGAGYWLEAGSRPRRNASPDSLFLGIGDPIYNAADPRRAVKPQVAHAGLAWPFRFHAPSAKEFVLPRLVGSASELDACSRSWNGESILLKGSDATRANLAGQMRRNPAVVHFATHILASRVLETHSSEGRVPGSSDRPAYGLIALSIGARNEPELLEPAEIAGWKLRGGLVVLSGCNSAEGTVLQGTGLMGLTRAWLAAGAESVIGSRWATPDEDGGLFRVFYHQLSTAHSADPAGALRLAQLEMAHSPGWRAHARYWGAFFMIGTR